MCIRDRDKWVAGELSEKEFLRAAEWDRVWNTDANLYLPLFCLLYTSDAADERSSVDLGGRRIIKKKTNVTYG